VIGRTVNSDGVTRPCTRRCVGWRWSAAVLCLAAAGCAYTREPVYPADIRTVAVPIFENRSTYRDVQFDLTEALIKQIELRTPYKVVSPELADTVLRGSVVHVSQNVLSRRRAGGLPQELEMQITAHLEWTDVRSGNVLRSRRGLTATGRYIPATPVGQPLEFARHAAVEHLAQSIVDLMRDDWGPDGGDAADAEAAQ